MAKSNLYRFKRVTENGREVYVKEHVSTREVKKAIMKENRWTESQYQKKYDLFKNKLRAKESFEIAHGLKVETFRAGLGDLQHYGAGHVVCVLHGNGVALKQETKAFFGESAWVCPQNQALTFADLRAVTPAK